MIFRNKCVSIKYSLLDVGKQDHECTLRSYTQPDWLKQSYKVSITKAGLKES